MITLLLLLVLLLLHMLLLLLLQLRLGQFRLVQRLLLLVVRLLLGHCLTQRRLDGAGRGGVVVRQQDHQLPPSLLEAIPVLKRLPAITQGYR